jgi:hypothetical protein
MGLGNVDGYMALPGELTSPSTTNDHGLRFINDDWNGSIANGLPFTLKWNGSIENEEGDLKLFKVFYPEEGAVAFELVTNLTGKSGVRRSDVGADVDQHSIHAKTILLLAPGGTGRG